MTAQPDVTSPGRTAWLPEGFEAIGPPLGVGATAIVWPARRVLDGRELALKVWRRPFADAGERERFRREIRRQAALNDVTGHVATYTWAEEDPPAGTPWIGTLRHGSSLAHLLERTGAPLPDGYALCADLLAGLAAMHGLGLVHRDVKPANVLAAGGRAQLCDLGLVLDEFGHTADGAAGTPRYLAPELAAGARPSARTDVYSAARTIREVLGADLPGPLERLLAAACSPSPDDRPADATAFATAFRAVSAGLGRPVPAPLPGRSGTTAGAHPVPPRRPRAHGRPSDADAAHTGTHADAYAHGDGEARTGPGPQPGARMPVTAVRSTDGAGRSGRGPQVLSVVAVVLALAAGALALLLPRPGTAPAATAPPAAASPQAQATATTTATATASPPASRRTPARTTPAATARPTATGRPTPAPTVPSRAPAPPSRPDARGASPDIAADGAPVVLPARSAARCDDTVPGARSTGEIPYLVGGTTVAVLRTYAAAGRACAKLVKPPGSPYAGTDTHLALTLCGDGNTCDGDWHAYPVDAGPVVVPSRDGCVSTRVSMTDASGRWVVRDDVRATGCR